MTEINPENEDIEAIKHFLEEREKIKRIVGRIGGKPTRYERIINATFFVLLVISFIIPLIFHGQTMRLLSIEFGVLLISLKILYSLAMRQRSPISSSGYSPQLSGGYMI